MSTPRTSPLAALRDSLWGFLTFSGVAWLAIGWCVLRLEPPDVVRTAGPVIVFGALTEVLRAFGGGRLWGLNAGMAVLFAATGGLVLVDQDSSMTTPAALIGWYLMVRGAADIAMSVLSRGADRTWGLVLALGVAQAGLGFYAASSFARTFGTVIMVLGGLALIRAVADLVAGMNLREAPVGTETAREHAAGVAGYAAGLADYAAAAAARSGRPRHRAAGMPATAEMGEPDAGVAAGTPGGGAGVTSDTAVTTANLDAVLALAGVSGAVVGSAWNGESVEPAAGGAPMTGVVPRGEDSTTEMPMISDAPGPAAVAVGAVARSERAEGGIDKTDLEPIRTEQAAAKQNSGTGLFGKGPGHRRAL